MHKRHDHIGCNCVRYMINEGLTSLLCSDMDNFYINHICKMGALGKFYKKSHNNSHGKCSVKRQITGESFNGNYYALGIIESNTNALCSNTLSLRKNI